MTYFRDLLNPVKYGKLSFQYLSRRVFRWVVCPLALPLILICNVLLVVFKINPMVLYQIVLGVQVFFYVLAILGWLLKESGIGKRKFFYVPYYFSFMNLSVWFGFFRYINGRQSAIWEKANRSL
jgi:hypothetical protein